MRVITTNPATEELLREFEFDSLDNSLALQKRCESAFRVWRRLSVSERASYLLKLGKLIAFHAEELAQAITREMGKPIGEARAEVRKCAEACLKISEDYPSWLRAEAVAGGDARSGAQVSVFLEPIGPILGIMPWNFPLWQVVRFAVPTLLLGNVVLIKHAPNTWGCAEALANLFREAEFPDGVYSNLKVDVSTTERLIAEAWVLGVSLTGSTRAGRRVGELAGRNLKKSVLELGGSDPYLVLDDADLAFAAKESVKSRMLNGGQSCIAAKRFIVTQQNHDEFVGLALKELSNFKPMDPTLEGCRLGPMARQDLRDGVLGQVQGLKESGVLALHANVGLPEKGYFVTPSLLCGVEMSMPLAQEEIFGPAAMVFKAKDEQHAIEIANQSDFALGAAVFSRDHDRAERIARAELNAGLCFVNGMVRSDPSWPFGGLKNSGYGRELGRYGIYEFANVKTVAVW